MMKKIRHLALFRRKMTGHQRCELDKLKKHDSYINALLPVGLEHFIMPDMTWIQMGGEL